MRKSFLVSQSFLIDVNFSGKPSGWAGVWEGLVNGSHTANAPLLICSPVIILRKRATNRPAWLTNTELPARSEDKASLIRSNTKRQRNCNTTLTVSKQHRD